MLVKSVKRLVLCCCDVWLQSRSLKYSQRRPRWFIKRRSIFTCQTVSRVLCAIYRRMFLQFHRGKRPELARCLCCPWACHWNAHVVSYVAASFSCCCVWLVCCRSLVFHSRGSSSTPCGICAGFRSRWRSWGSRAAVVSGRCNRGRQSHAHGFCLHECWIATDNVTSASPSLPRAPAISE